MSEDLKICSRFNDCTRYKEFKYSCPHRIPHEEKEVCRMHCVNSGTCVDFDVLNIMTTIAEKSDG
jgi:hypothetical protein